jgi:DeoR family transcriptional regulator, aga operon transcriptional repressor
VLEKREIELAAAELVVDGETIAIGAGTTTTQAARSIRHRKGITIVTMRSTSRWSSATGMI